MIERWYLWLPLAVLTLAIIIVQGDENYQLRKAKWEAGRSLCCLCACGARDERICSNMCTSLQHSHVIINEDVMDSCTRECKLEHVAQ